MRLSVLAVLALVLVACSHGRDGGAHDFAQGNFDLAGFIPPSTDLAGADLAYTPGDGVIYAHTAGALYTVDPASFALTMVGSFGTSDEMTDLAVTPNNDIYTISKTSLYHVDPTSGAATQVMTGISSSNVALTFQKDGTLLAADQGGTVRVIDPVANMVTELGTYGSGYDTAGDLVAVSDGTLFGVSTKAPGVSGASNVLIKVDTTNASATTVGSIGYTGVFGVAYTGGRVIAFTSSGQVIRIDPTTGAGTLVATDTNIDFYGAGTSPLVPIM
jgi:streptogramin lyase